MKTEPTRELRLELPESTMRRLEVAATSWNNAHPEARLKLRAGDIAEKALGEWLQAHTTEDVPSR